MKLGVSFGGGVKADQYSYIAVFIQYLRDIIDIIKDLLGFAKSLEKETTAAVVAETTTAVEGE